MFEGIFELIAGLIFILVLVIILLILVTLIGWSGLGRLWQLWCGVGLGLVLSFAWRLFVLGEGE